MTDATVIAIVTIVCGMIVTVVQLLTRSEVMNLKNTIGDQTKELAGLHQTITLQSAKIYRQEAQKDDLIEKIEHKGRPAHKPPSDEPYTGNPPYKAK